eukprot:12921525-Prorocentrum_lima.AAC.1
MLIDVGPRLLQVPQAKTRPNSDMRCMKHLGCVMDRVRDLRGVFCVARNVPGAIPVASGLSPLQHS